MRPRRSSLHRGPAATGIDLCQLDVQARPVLTELVAKGGDRLPDQVLAIVGKIGSLDLEMVFVAFLDIEKVAPFDGLDHRSERVHPVLLRRANLEAEVDLGGSFPDQGARLGQTQDSPPERDLRPAWWGRCRPTCRNSSAFGTITDSEPRSIFRRCPNPAAANSIALAAPGRGGLSNDANDGRLDLAAAGRTHVAGPGRRPSDRREDRRRRSEARMHRDPGGAAIR